MDIQAAIGRAIKAGGGPAAVALACGVTPQAVVNWRGRGVVPADMCALLERVSCGAVTRRELRPDDWHRIWPELVDAEHPAPAADSTPGALDTAEAA